MKLLIVGSNYHPEELAAAEARLSAAQRAAEPPLFPPSQDQYLWVRALRRLGHEVQAFIRNVPALLGAAARRSQQFTGARTFASLVNALSSRAPRLQVDYHLRNRRLLDQARRFAPDALLMVGGNRVIFPETLARLRAQGCTIVYLTGDSPVVFASAIERAAAPLYDLVVVNDLYHGIEWLDYGAARMETLPLSACDPEFHRFYPDETGEFACEVGFVGTLLPPKLYSERVAALEAAREFGLGVWSIHGIPDSLRVCYRGPALGERALRAICGAKIQINPHGNTMRYGGNLRLFEAAGCGVFQIVDDRPGVPTWFRPGEHLAIYRDLARLKTLIAHYLKRDDERQQMARAAQAHAYAHHTYDQRMARLVALIEALR